MTTYYLLGLLFLPSSLCQDATSTMNRCDPDNIDADCTTGDRPCCSRFGFCGKDPGFCDWRAPGAGGGGGSVVGSSNGTCTIPDTELVGGDLASSVGGGGLKLARGAGMEDCLARCKENPGCLWYTWDSRDHLCHLKSGRGYQRSRQDGFTSGATFQDGCRRDPPCLSPYTAHGPECHFFARQRRPFASSRELCSRNSGFLPYDYSQLSDSDLHTDSDRWHWLGYDAEPTSGQCYAGRPARWGEGARLFPCSSPLHFSCERQRTFPLPQPARPRLQGDDFRGLDERLDNGIGLLATRTREKVVVQRLGRRRNRFRGRGRRRWVLI